MNMSIANPQENEGPIYAVQWNNAAIIQNLVPMGTPAVWNTLSVPNVPESTMRYVAGNASTVTIVGTFNNHYEWDGGSWKTIHNKSARSSVIYDNKVYVGYDSNAGVAITGGQGQQIAPAFINRGWEQAIPETIYKLTAREGVGLYAATSEGVWKYE